MHSLFLLSGTHEPGLHELNKPGIGKCAVLPSVAVNQSLNRKIDFTKSEKQENKKIQSL